MTTTHDTGLTEYQKELKERYTEVIDAGSDGFRVRLHMGCQQFTLDLTYEPEEADWTRDMLAKALHTLILNERGDSYGKEDQ